MPWKILQTHATRITKGPRKGDLGAAQRYTKHCAAELYIKALHTGFTRTKGENKRQVQMCGKALRQTRALPAKVTRQRAGKGTAKPYTKTWTTADKSGHRADKCADKDHTKTKDWTQSWPTAKSQKADYISIDPKQFFKHRVRLRTLTKGEFGDTKWIWMKLTSRPALQTLLVAQLAKKLCLMMPRPCPTAGQERTKSRSKDKALADRQGLEPQPKRTQGRHMADASRSHGGRMADKVWRRGQSGFKADTRRARGGHMADKLGDAAKAYRS